MMSYAAVTASHPEDQVPDPPLVYAADLEADLQQPDAKADEDYQDALDEVHTRFLLNVPQEELSTSERIFFQVEQAWWYYEDLICDQLVQDTGVCHLPRFSSLKPFAKRLWEFSPLLSHLDFAGPWKEFAIYKTKISTYGCILLNHDLSRVALCQMYQSNTWSFPAGKINQNEVGIQAAARETYEETGFDPSCKSGLTNEWATNEPDKVTWNPVLRDPEDALTYVEKNNGKRRTLYVCCGVPEDFPFAPVCRKEVDSIEWIDLKDVPKLKSFAVLPFVGKLKKWIKKRQQTENTKKKKKDRKNKSRPKSRPKSNGRPNSTPRQTSRKKDRKQLVDAGLMETMGDSTRWTEEEMFATNSRLQGGRTVEYDGNPHAFAEEGFGVDDAATGSQRIDPHSFRVVGGSFMNSRHGDQLAVAADPTANYQPLVREEGNSDGLQPFFSQHGVTPWGETVNEAKSDDGDEIYSREDEDEEFATEFQSPKPSDRKTVNAGQDLLAMLQTEPSASAATPPRASGDYNYDDDDGMMMFATDREITAKKQREHALRQQQQPPRPAPRNRQATKERLVKEYEENMAYVHQWVANLPNPPMGFKIRNVDAILDRHYGPGTSRNAALAAARHS